MVSSRPSAPGWRTNGVRDLCHLVEPEPAGLQGVHGRQRRRVEHVCVRWIQNPSTLGRVRRSRAMRAVPSGPRSRTTSWGRSRIGEVRSHVLAVQWLVRLVAAANDDHVLHARQGLLSSRFNSHGTLSGGASVRSRSKPGKGRRLPSRAAPSLRPSATRVPWSAPRAGSR